ncbi:MAG: hypothetical protein KZQ58_06150 [gamma proteobacterium symbiont of Bathyaustriella thionipta]|nr:hypothetical protein [gamma proteobacterium symbiont of Bathyaustriella thionipta]
MVIKVYFEDQVYEMDVPDEFVRRAQDFFQRMDQDMDKGWQMSRDWVDKPDSRQRCQIVSNKLASALDNEDRKTAMMMAGYLVKQMPELSIIDIDASGDISLTEFTLNETAAAQQAVPAAQADAGKKIGKIEALAQAGQEISKVSKVGRGYRFSIFNKQTQEWQHSATLPDKQEAEKLRDQAFKKRFDELTQ